MRNVFILGGTSGIGWHLAQLYLSKGDRVGIGSRNPDKENWDFTQYKNLLVYQLDVTNKESLQEALDAFCSLNTNLDIIINSAGCYFDSALQEVTFEQANQMLQTNIMGAVNTLDVASNQMKRANTKGKIAIIASISALMDYPKATIYSKTKRSILVVADAYQRALIPFNIHISCICPGYVATSKLYELNGGDLSKKQYVISPIEGAQRIYDGIECNQTRIVFPKKMYRLIKLLNVLPTFLLQKIMYKKAKWQSKK